MIKGLLFVLLFASGFGITYLLYGKEGMALRERQGKKNFITSILLGFLMLLWGMALLFWISGLARNDTPLCIALTFAIPVILVLAGFKTRANVRKALSDESGNNPDKT